MRQLRKLFESLSLFRKNPARTVQEVTGFQRSYLAAGSPEPRPVETRFPDGSRLRTEISWSSGDLMIDFVISGHVPSTRALFNHLAHCPGCQIIRSPFGTTKIEVGYTRGLKVVARETHVVLLGGWAHAYVEDDATGFVWYLASDTIDAIERLAAAGIAVDLPSTDDSRRFAGDMGHRIDFQAALEAAAVALRAVERASLLAWTAGKIALRWPYSMAPGREDMRVTADELAAFYATLARHGRRLPSWKSERVNL